MNPTSIRDAYDTVAEDYAALLRHELAAKPFDRAMLAAFADLVRGEVADVGCGPGRITAHLRDLGVEVFGVDLSPGMVAAARRAHPELRFEVGSMTGLDVADGALGGVVSWYSIVHTPVDDLGAVFAEFHRVLAGGGHLLVQFKAGDRVRTLSRAYGHDLSLDVYWHPVERVAEIAVDAGFVEVGRLTRAADEQEAGPQAGLILTKPTPASP